MCTVLLGSKSDFLTLKVHGRTTPNAQDYWDANWLHCTVHVAAAGCRTSSEWQLRNEDLARFLRDLEDLDTRVGVALLETGDGWLDVQLTRDDGGQLNAQCQLEEHPVGEKVAEFQLLLDQESLPALVAQIREVLKRFPVLGGGP
jgi:hypothetical protein